MADGGAGDGSSRAARDDMENLNAVVQQFTEDQNDRYEAFRTSHLNVASVRRHLGEVLPASLLAAKGSKTVGENRIVRAVQITGKLFVGDVVERARELMVADGETGPIRPEFIKQAHSQLCAEGKVVHARPSTRALSA